MVSVGTSRFDVLAVDEMKQINKTVAQMAKGKALNIATTLSKGLTSQAFDFARNAQSVGTDGILAIFPDRYYVDDGEKRY